MAGSVNKVIIIGNLGRDPVSRSLPNGGKVVSFSVATSETWKDKATGERKERTEWHAIVVFNEALATVAEKYLHKGSKVYAEGKLQTRKWQDKDGIDRYSTEIVLQGFDGTLTLLDKLQPDPGRTDYSGHDDGRWSSDRPGGAAGTGGAAPPAPDLDDDVPF